MQHSDDPRLRTALFRVAATIFPTDTDSRSEEVTAAPEGGWYRADVRFRGQCDGQVSVAFPVPLAMQMAVAFLAVDEAAEWVAHDLCGDFAHKVASAWLAALAMPVPFSLGIPLVTRVDAPPDGLRLRVNGQPVVIACECRGDAQ